MVTNVVSSTEVVTTVVFLVKKILEEATMREVMHYRDAVSTSSFIHESGHFLQIVSRDRRKKETNDIDIDLVVKIHETRIPRR